MPLPKPLNVQQSRFAAIALDSDSESDSGNEGEWKQVPKAASKGSLKAGEQHADESKPLSKNAKKRARKRRNRCSASSEVVKFIALSLDSIIYIDLLIINVLGLIRLQQIWG